MSIGTIYIQQYSKQTLKLPFLKSSFGSMPQKNPILGFFLKKHKNPLVLCPKLTQKKFEPF